LSDVKFKQTPSLKSSNFDSPFDFSNLRVPNAFTERLTGTESKEDDLRLWISFVKEMNEEGIHFIRPSQIMQFAYDGNPLLCGTIAFNFAILREQAGCHWQTAT
jgi:hypothetical protein